MIINNISTLGNISESEGFGINTNLLETNVLNLAVVIGVLIYFGKDILRDSLNARKEMILKNMRDSVEKKIQAVENLNNAKLQFEEAKEKSEEIRSQGFVTAKDTSDKILERMEDSLKRLEETKFFTIRFEEEKAITEVCNKVSRSALEKAVKKLTSSMNSKVRKKILTRNISLLENLSLSFISIN